MPDSSQSIPLLRFCAGSMYFGVAAEDVAAVAPVEEDGVHIGTILGIDAAPETSPGDRRMIHLAAVPGQPTSIAFQADVPVDVVRCHASDLLPLPSGMPRDRWKPVMGFARVTQQLILLLDIPSVIAKLMDNAQGGTP